MLPPIFVVDPRIAPDPNRHIDRPHVRRGQPEVLQLWVSRHHAPHGPSDAPIPVVPAGPEHRALLIALANDPRFAKRSGAAPKPVGWRVRLGQALMALGWRLVSPARHR